MQDLFLQMFGKNFGDNDSQNLLRDVTKQYPYFSAAQLFLLKKTATSDTDYKEIAARTALHFDNPYLLNLRLNQTGKVVNQVATATLVQEKAPIISIPLPEAIATAPAIEKDEMIFEPLFASDYFASQGIKLSEEVQPNDKLGKQLKSFTEWLKSMKKVHEVTNGEPNVQIDMAVQQLAEKSNQEDDVITESMAEAYLQQGKMKKARETFQKLSLLNPAKSAYFAAKIESITLNQ